MTERKRGRPRSPICPRCKLRPKAKGQGYCAECRRVGAKPAPSAESGGGHE